jgi:hypothetical protein
MLWQWATVTVNYNGNWTALLWTGALAGVPQTLSSEHIDEFPGSVGYDGQMHHYMAHAAADFRLVSIYWRRVLQAEIFPVSSPRSNHAVR